MPSVSSSENPLVSLLDLDAARRLSATATARHIRGDAGTPGTHDREGRVKCTFWARPHDRAPAKGAPHGETGAYMAPESGSRTQLHRVKRLVNAPLTVPPQTVEPTAPGRWKMLHKP